MRFAKDKSMLALYSKVIDVLISYFHKISFFGHDDQ